MRYVTLLVLFMMIPILAEEPEWRQLEKEVKFAIWSRSSIDSLRAERGVQAATPAPFVVPKRLPAYDKSVYRVRWGALNVGYGYMENTRLDNVQINSGKALTSGLVAHFLKVRNLSWSLNSAYTLAPLFLRESNFEDGLSKKKPYIKEDWSLYDSKEGRVIYQSKKSVKNVRTALETHNYMTAVYLMRNHFFAVGDTFSFPLFVHDKQFDFKVVALKKETVTLDRIEYHCMKIQPLLVGTGHGFNAKDKLYIWIDMKYPYQVIQAKAEARKGTVYARIIHSEHR